MCRDFICKPHAIGGVDHSVDVASEPILGGIWCIVIIPLTRSEHSGVVVGQRFGHPVQINAFACQPDIIEFEECLRLILVSRLPPSTRATCRDVERLFGANGQRYRYGNARNVVDASLVHGGSIGGEPDVAAFPRGNYSCNLVNAAGHILHHLSDAEARCPPLVGVHQVLAVLPTHAVVSCLEFIVAVRVFANERPPRLVARLERWVHNQPCGINGVGAAGRKELLDSGPPRF